MKGARLCSALLIAGALLPVPAPAQDAAQSDKITRLVIYGNDPCPRGRSGEIIVCARRPETERYRIPEALRDDAVTPDPESESWASRAQALETAGRTGIQSCSTSGPAGFTGCWEQMIRAARDERRANAANQPDR